MTKKPTKKTTKKPIKRKPPQPNAHIESCTFIGVQWDIESLGVLKTVAQGLTNLTELFKSQNVTIESLLTVGNKDKDKLE